MPCTTILVGKKASYDGSTMIARNDDSPSGQFTPKKFVVVHPEEQPKKYKSVLSHVEIDLPEDPMRYTAVPNALDGEGIWAAHGVNAAGVGMTATETITSNARVLGADPLVEYVPAKDGVEEISGGIGEEDIVSLVLPYIHSAREGVTRLGSLLEKYGTYEMNGIAFSDKNEIWWLETIGGHHWIARRVPDDAYVVMPNQFGIDAFDLEDALTEQKEHMCSADLKEFIEKNHLDLSQDGNFSARDAFGSHDDSDHVYNTARAWYMLRTLNPRTKVWDGPNAEYTPFSDDLPWCMVPEKKEEQFEFVVKMAVIIKELMNGCDNLAPEFSEEAIGHNALAAGFQGQRQWTDFYPNGDFAEAMLNTSFDWNGAREPYILATENDVLNGLGMLFMKLLTGRAQIFADVRTYWSPEAVKKATGYDLEGVAKEAGGFLHLINSGAACLDANGQAKEADGTPVMKQWWDVTEADQKAIMDNTEWCMADNGYFRGGGYSSRYETRAQMPATMIRLNLVKGLGPVLQIAEGWTVALPEEVSDKLWKRTDYTWPCTWFAPRCDGKEGPFKTAYDVMNNWGANHGAISYGHIGADLITMCSMLRIPVSMHNVPEKDIYRPAAWNAFGMEKEGADFRACKNYGPLYK